MALVFSGAALAQGQSRTHSRLGKEDAAFGIDICFDWHCLDWDCLIQVALEDVAYISGRFAYAIRTRHRPKQG